MPNKPPLQWNNEEAYYYYVKRFFPDTTPKVIIAAVEVGPRVAMRDTIHTEGARQGNPPTAQMKAAKNKGTICCKWSQRNHKLSPHSVKFKVLLSVKRDIVTNLHAGRIKEFIGNWALLTQDSWVLQRVQGFYFPLVAQPFQVSPPSQIGTSILEAANLGINRDTNVDRETGNNYGPARLRGFVSQIFLVPKKDGDFCVVINLKALNKFIAEEHLKMEEFHMVKDLAKPCDWLTKLDPKDAFFWCPQTPVITNTFSFYGKG